MVPSANTKWKKLYDSGCTERGSPSSPVSFICSLLGATSKEPLSEPSDMVECTMAPTAMAKRVLASAS